MEHNSQITKAAIQTLIIALKLPPIILDLFNGTCTDNIVLRNLRQDYGEPYQIFCLTGLQQDSYFTDRYKPILSYTNSTIYAYDMVSKGYIKYSVELMNKNPEYFTWDGLFVRDILFWWELEISDEDILYIGNLFGLKYTKDILDSIYITHDKNGFTSFQDTELWASAMIAKINGKVI